MTDPKRHRQLTKLDTVELCTQILHDARNEFHLNIHFLDILLSSLNLEAAATPGIGTDGFATYYSPDYLFRLYRQGRSYVNRVYLHTVLHCLFYHMGTRGEREKEHWDSTYDIAMEFMFDGPYRKRIHRPQSAFHKEAYLRLEREMEVLTAEGIYAALRKMNLVEKRYNRLTVEFCVNNHARWHEDDTRKQTQPRQNKWNDNREKMQIQIKSMAGESAENADNLMEQMRTENWERYDYKKFLRKFSVFREESQMDEDSLNYTYYIYGLSICGNIPLTEPPEAKKIYRIEDSVVMIDTSMSCSRELVRQFLEETYTVLCGPETYFEKTNTHIVQCDGKIQLDRVITSQDETDAYMRDSTIIGEGGTDFRPAFEYANRLREQGASRELRGLLCFTDGEGICPVRRPVYDMALVFMKEQHMNVLVSPQATKLILEPEKIGSPPHTGSEENMVGPTHVGPAESIEMGNGDERQTGRGRD